MTAAIATRTAARGRTQYGVTLVELAATVAVAGILAGSAGPWAAQMQAASRIDSAAAALRSDLQYARALSIARSESVHFVSHVDDSGSCYVVHAGPRSSCTCSAATGARCTDETSVQRSLSFPAGQPVGLAGPSTVMTFSPTAGTVTPTGSLTMSTPQGHRLRLVVNVMGRVRTCVALGDLAGLPRC